MGRIELCEKAGYSLTKLFEGKVEMKDGFIITDEEMKTSVEGVFACGDLRPKMLKQVVIRYYCIIMVLQPVK